MPEAAARDAAGVTIAAFNAHWGVGRFRPWRGVPLRRCERDASFDADIVIVAESWRDEDGRGMLDSLTRLGYQVENTKLLPVIARTDRGSVHDLAPHEATWELVLCSRYPVRDRRRILLPPVNRDPFYWTSRPDMHSRHRRPEFRSRCATRIVKTASTRAVRHLMTLKKRLPNKRPQILARDFNLWGPAVSIVMPGWTRPVRGRTYPSHRPHSQIDHVLVRGGIEVLDGQVLPATPSDHRPARARLRLPKTLP